MNSLLVDSGSKGWADMYIDTLKAYDDIFVEKDLVVGGDASINGFLDVKDEILINSQPMYKSEIGTLDVSVDGVIKTAKTIGYTAFKIMDKVTVILNRAFDMESTDTGNDGKILIGIVPSDYRPFGERFTTALMQTPSNGVVLAKCKIDATGHIRIDNIDNSSFTASTGGVFSNTSNIVFDYNINHVPNN